MSRTTDRSNPLHWLSDLLLAGMVVVLILTMILRIPQGLVDVLIATNIGLSVIILLAALYIPEASRFPSFPTVLLLSTLFRLALNVSTTRLILLEGDAGRIILAFGDFVVRGDFVVGGVVFVVLVLVQFIVITKGAERVAEVSARFTLDAMPGKQMSIDADLRAGQITNDQARQRREDLERESKLYGAMDGAMKFVKGDAIAGILIALINIIGGLIIGVVQRGLPVGEAAQLYALLTIGDGLVSQIPSLLIGLAAGLVVTRVSAQGSSQGSGHAAHDIARQLLAQPMALGVASMLMLALAASSPVTTLPPLPFLALGLAAGVGALAARRAGQAAPEEPGAGPETTRDSVAPDAGLLLTLHPALQSWLGADGTTQRQERLAAIQGACDEVSLDLGLKAPALAVAFSARLALANGYALAIHGIPVDQGTMAGDAQAFCSQLRLALRRHAAACLGIQETSDLLDRIKETQQELHKAVLPTVLSVQQVMEVLQGLLGEQVPIRNLRCILQSLARWGPDEKRPAMLIELVRRDLAGVLCDRYSDGARRLAYYAVAPEFAARLEQAATQTPRGTVLDLDPAERRRMIRALREALRSFAGPSPVVLVSPDVRPLLRLLVEHELPDVVVLSHAELAPHYAAEPLGIISPPAPGGEGSSANGDNHAAGVKSSGKVTAAPHMR